MQGKSRISVLLKNMYLLDETLYYYIKNWKQIK